MCYIIFKEKIKHKNSSELAGSLMNGDYLFQGFQKDCICQTTFHLIYTEDQSNSEMHCRTYKSNVNPTGKEASPMEIEKTQLNISMSYDDSLINA